MGRTRPGSGRLGTVKAGEIHVPKVSSGDAGFQCAGCGEWNDTFVDESAGGRQSYVEDCQVCCKPNVLRILWDGRRGAYRIEAELES